MINQTETFQLIQESFDSLTRSGTIESQVTIKEQTILLGSGALLDSIGFVTFVTDMEDRMEQKLGQECYLVLNEISEFNINNPSLSAGVLAEYLVQLAKQVEDKS